MMFKIFVILLALSSNVISVPVAHRWPDEYTVEFAEDQHFPYRGLGKTTGKLWYSWKQQAFRIDRENGNYDRMCGTVRLFKNRPCNIYVVEGIRYLYWPHDGYCCNCCDAKNGCGLIMPDFTTRGEFAQTKTDANGVTYNEFMLDTGTNTDIWKENADDFTPYSIFQQPFSEMFYNQKTFKTDPIPSSVFVLPSSKCNQMCTNLSGCAKFRKKK